jgi:two-component system, OmpR family, sensor histidine kinase KdpD
MPMKGYLLAVGSFMLLTLLLWPLREVLTLANFTMLYTLYVLIAAIKLGTYPAMIAAFAGFLAINFFLIRPYYTFLVADSREVIDLAVFIVVAALAGQLAARARMQAQVAEQRANEQETLYKLTRQMNQAVDKEEVHRALIQALEGELHVRQARILPGEASDPPQRLNEAVQLLLLKAGGEIYGTVSVSSPGEITMQQRRLLATGVTQAAMALHRIELAERVRSSQQYEEADRLKTAILRAVSHDLRTPITIIKSSASNLRTLNEKLDAPERLEIAQAIEHEADHLNTLVGNLLDLSRLQAGALTLNRELNSLEEVVGDVAARVWQLTGSERLEIYFDDDMPLIPFDYGLILQAVSNLVENALRYETPDRRIVIRGFVQNGQAQVRIINHGETIPADARNQIMEPFFQGKGGGRVGLGLPIARGIAEAHHGQLLLEDTPGGGATFVLVLPVENEECVSHERENPGC